MSLRYRVFAALPLVVALSLFAVVTPGCGDDGGEGADGGTEGSDGGGGAGAAEGGEGTADGGAADNAADGGATAPDAGPVLAPEDLELCQTACEHTAECGNHSDVAGCIDTCHVLIEGADASGEDAVRPRYVCWRDQDCDEIITCEGN